MLVPTCFNVFATSPIVSAGRPEVQRNGAVITAAAGLIYLARILMLHSTGMMHVNHAQRASSNPISVRRSAAHRTCRASQAQQAPADSARHPQTAGQISRRHALVGASGAVALLAAGRAEAAMQLPAKETVDAESAYIQGNYADSPRSTLLCCAWSPSQACRARAAAFCQTFPAARLQQQYSAC